jgi:anti-sigma regulatory factor (Ser/Thr protein kinase)
MPLGLMPGMTYEEKAATIAAGQSILLYSDGLVEAHSPDKEMFGFPRLQRLMGTHPGGEELIGFLLDRLVEFTGITWEQEDDVTLVTLQRLDEAEREAVSPRPAVESGDAVKDTDWRVIAEFEVSSQPGNERLAMEQVAEIVRGRGLMLAGRLERLKTAVAEATMNAMEHGNRYRADLPVTIRVLQAASALAIHIIDQGGAPATMESAVPDLEAKLEGLQTPRGWGLFLIENMVDEMRVRAEGQEHVVELVMALQGEEHDDKPV